MYIVGDSNLQYKNVGDSNLQYKITIIIIGTKQFDKWCVICIYVLDPEGVAARKYKLLHVCLFLLFLTFMIYYISFNQCCEK